VSSIKIKLAFLLLFVSTLVSSQVDTTSLKIVSWNIQNFGKSKSNDEILYISNKLKDCDIVAIQEVSTSDFGSQAVAKLDDYLDRTGSKWDYVISDKTTGDGPERYAYLYKTHRVKLKEKSSLEKSLQDGINREPFRVIFIFKGKEFYLFNIHLVPTDKNPDKEAMKLDTLPKIYKDKTIIIMGDFNLSGSHKGFDNLKKFGFKCSLVSKKTSLKAKESSDPMNMEYDNFFISKNIKLVKSDVIYFYKDFKTLKDARKISDHCPIYCIIK
jgi:endonuclease/exonuclease/phosphatase family metal-dependent hydrolase